MSLIYNARKHSRDNDYYSMRESTLGMSGTVNVYPNVSIFPNVK